jgi:hypothetical protein
MTYPHKKKDFEPFSHIGTHQKDPEIMLQNMSDAGCSW